MDCQWIVRCFFLHVESSQRSKNGGQESVSVLLWPGFLHDFHAVRSLGSS